MNVHRLNHSFTAGELSPMMNSRKDFDRYKNGCHVLENMFCATQGPAVRRPGLLFIYDLVSLGLDITDPQIREIPFIFSELQSYAMIFFMHTDGDPRMVLGNGTGLVVGSGDAYTYDSATQLDYLGASLAQTPFRYAGDTENSQTVVHTTAAGSSTTLTLTTDYTIDYTDSVCTVTTTATAPVLTAGDYLTVTINMTSTAILATEVVELVLPTTFEIEDMDWAQSADEMRLAQSGYVPTTIVRYQHDSWKLETTGFVNRPSDWSDTNGWPERVTFHQQRVLYGANSLRRQTIWGSKAGDFIDFDAGSAEDDEAFTFTLDSGTQNRIQWMVSSKSLHVGTLGDEWTVSGATRNALTPGNILAQRQTNNGSENNKPLMVGLTTLFVERHGRTIDEFVYDYTYDSYKTSDLAIISPHVTENYSISDWTYQQTPDSIIWAVRSDGVMLGLTYQRQHKVVGWHRHITDGEFKAVTAIPGDTREDDVWVVVKRTIDSVVGYFVEKFVDAFKGTTSVEGFFLDSHVVYDSTATDTIDGLDHLDGEEVDILADGTVHPPRTVASGEITLNNDYSVVVVGLPYTSEVRPLLSEVPSQDGSAMGRLQRIFDIDVDLYRSLGMQLGRYSQEDGESVEVVPFRVPTDSTGEAVPLYTGIKHLSFPEGLDRDSVYFLRQTQPLPLTVRGIVDNVEVYE